MGFINSRDQLAKHLCDSCVTSSASAFEFLWHYWWALHSIPEPLVQSTWALGCIRNRFDQIADESNSAHSPRASKAKYDSHLLQYFALLLLCCRVYKREIHYVICVTSRDIFESEVSENSRSREFLTRVSFIFSRSTTRNDFLKSRSRLETWE